MGRWRSCDTACSSLIQGCASVKAMSASSCRTTSRRSTRTSSILDPSLRASTARSTFERTRSKLFYFDPPYVPVSDTSDFTSYTKDGFTMADQERLCRCAGKLKKRGVQVILSNADVPAVRKLYHGFHIHRVEASRSINSKASKRGPVGEVIIT
jgi:site-specific DNA-adenine methylase